VPGVVEAEEAAAARVLDLRGQGVAGVSLRLRFPAGHRVLVTGLPGSGKTTLMHRARAARGHALTRMDSQDVRDQFGRALPGWLPYEVYRPAVRVVHYARLWGASRGPASLVVHDSGRTPWVRRWLGLGGRGFHLVVLDVTPGTALAGQAARGRGVPRQAFPRYRRALARLVGEVEAERLPRGCVSATLLDREAAQALREIVFVGGVRRPR
jgi:hypothetical protein